jgi:hypothetical protein
MAESAHSYWKCYRIGLLFPGPATLFDERRGRIMNPSLAEYHVPVHLDVPHIEIIWNDMPERRRNRHYGRRGGSSERYLSRDRKAHSRFAVHIG